MKTAIGKILVLTIILLFIPVTLYNPDEWILLTHIEENQISSLISKKTQPTIFAESNEDLLQWNLTLFKGNKIQKLSLPPKSATYTSDEGERTVQFKKPGYLTWSNSAETVFWYPQLGKMVYLFNQNGKLIWSIKENRYIEISPDGKLILAAGGDHSHATFLLPSWETITRIEGLSFVSHQWAPETPQGTNEHACISFFNGDHVVTKLYPKVETFRFQTEQVLKNAWCDFKNRQSLLQLQGEKQQHVSLLKWGEVDTNYIPTLINNRYPEKSFKKDELNLKKLIDLPIKTIHSIPMLLLEEEKSVIIYPKNSIIFLKVNDKTWSLPIPMEDFSSIRLEPFMQKKFFITTKNWHALGTTSGISVAWRGKYIDENVTPSDIIQMDQKEYSILKPVDKL